MGRSLELIKHVSHFDTTQRELSVTTTDVRETTLGSKLPLGMREGPRASPSFSRARNERFRERNVFRHMLERIVEAWIAAGLVAAKALRSLRA